MGSKMPIGLSKSQATIGVKAAAILLATSIMFWQDLTILANEAIQSEFMTHILAIPFLFSYLLYRKRKMLKATISFKIDETRSRPIVFSNVTIGTVVCLVAILLYWYGSSTFIPLEYHVTSLVVFVSGCAFILFNAPTLRALAFPIAFLIFLIPPPLEIIYTLGSTMSVVSSQAAYMILKTIGLPVSLIEQYQTPVIVLQTSNSPLTFAVDIACSGIYSLIGFLIFAIFVAYISKGRLWKKVTTFSVGFPIIYFLNILRITIVVLIGNQFGMETAMHAFHLFGGWVLIFLGTFLILTLSNKILKTTLFKTKTKTKSCPACTLPLQDNKGFCHACGNLLNSPEIRLHKEDIVKIVALFATVVLLLSIQTPVFALTQGPAEVILQTAAGQQVTTDVLPEIPGYTSQFIYRDTAFEERAKQDASLTYLYTSTSNSSRETYWVTIELARSKSHLHRWEACLITYAVEVGRQPSGIQLDLRDVELLQNPPIIGRYFAFQWRKTNQTQVVLYWYERATFQTNSTPQQEYAKITIIAFPEDTRNIKEIEEKMLPFAKAIVNYWQPIKTWSQIAITISQNGPILISIASLTLTILAVAWATHKQIQKKTAKTTYQKLSEKDKKILLATREATLSHGATGKEIALAYKNLTGEEIESDVLGERLLSMEKVALIEQQIANENDQPVITWKAIVSLS